ncbi:MAG TPA: hypothetical protein DIW46_00390 [Microbacterium sp.]|uniref:LysR family transcriptional regulator n=1 Tax=Microbacterium sp. TaxID=51671 RepID=UPI000EDDD809|nr:hypothetical protein [Microbacterium sp.]
MDALKLEAFLLVAEEESFSAAADRARTAQSTISSRVKELESALGQPLFVRSSRQVRLSPAGEAAVPAARRALAALDTVRQVVDEVAGVRRGRVRLGVVTGAEAPELGRVLADFSAEYPGIELIIVSGSGADLEEAVGDGSLDIALVVRSSATALMWEGLLHDSLSAISSSAESETAASGPISISVLERERLIVLDAGAGARGALEAAARRAGIRLSIAAQVSTPGMAEELHQRGMGMLIVPESLSSGRGARIVDLDHAELAVDVGLVAHPGVRSPAVELLLARLISDFTLFPTDS